MGHVTFLGRALIRKACFGLPLCGLAALAAIFVPQRSANASLMVTLTSGATTDTITDNEVGADSNPTTGTIVNSSFINGFGVAITVAVSNSPGSSTGGTLQITSLDITNTSNSGQATLTIQTSDTGFTQPGSSSSPGMSLINALSGTFGNAAQTGDTVQFQSFADGVSVQPASAFATAPLSFSYPTGEAPNNNSFSGNNTLASWTRGAAGYSLSDTATVTLAPGDSVNITGQTTAISTGSSVPEPASLGTLALGALLLGRRRSSSK